MINLLPPSYKKELRQEAQFRIWFTISISLIAGLIVATLLFFGIWLYLQGIIYAYQAQILPPQTRQGGYAEFRAEIQQQNTFLVELRELYDKDYSMMDIFRGLEETLPKDIRLTSLNYTPREEGARIAITGFSPTRAELLEFQSTLREYPSFHNIVIPQSVWVAGEEITFSVTFELLSPEL